MLVCGRGRQLRRFKPALRGQRGQGAEGCCCCWRRRRRCGGALEQGVVEGRSGARGAWRGFRALQDFGQCVCGRLEGLAVPPVLLFLSALPCSPPRPSWLWFFCCPLCRHFSLLLLLYCTETERGTGRTRCCLAGGALGALRSLCAAGGAARGSRVEQQRCLALV